MKVRSACILVLVAVAACGDVAPRNTCYAGFHYNGGLCLSDDTCTDTTCNGHGACTQASAMPTCACDYQYNGANCTECAAGYHDDGNGTCTNGCPGSTLDCGRFGTCL